jgi:hypothetical protein
MATPHDIMICDNCSRTLGVIFVPNSALFTIACTTCVHEIAEAKESSRSTRTRSGRR